MLLKIGVEITAVMLSQQSQQPPYDFREAKHHVISHSGQTWPYFVLRDKNALSHLVSVFEATPDEHHYITQCGFDIFLHEVDEEVICFFAYGIFFAAISLTSRCTAWRAIFSLWRVSHVGCPLEYAPLSN